MSKKEGTSQTYGQLISFAGQNTSAAPNTNSVLVTLIPRK